MSPDPSCLAGRVDVAPPSAGTAFAYCPAAEPSAILVASNFPPVRGGSAVVYESLARFGGGQVAVIAPERNYLDDTEHVGCRDFDAAAPYRVIRLPLLRSLLRTRERRHTVRLVQVVGDLLVRSRLVLHLLAAIIRFRARVVCIGELDHLAWLINLLRMSGFIRILVYVHGEEITVGNGQDLQRDRQLRALRNAHGIVTVSEFSAGNLKKMLPPSHHAKLKIIRNGVDSGRFHPGDKRGDLCAKFDVEGKFVLLSICRLVEKKGIDRSIEAFARLRLDCPECRYIIGGVGPYKRELWALAQKLGVAQEVIFAGAIPDVDLPDFYRLADLFVMPNRALDNGDTEGFGLVFLEAGACGIPVIAGRAGGSTEAVLDQVTGLVVDGTSVDEIAAAMATLRNDAALRSRLGLAGRARAVAADWRRKAAEFLAFARTVRPPPRSPWLTIPRTLRSD